MVVVIKETPIITVILVGTFLLVTEAVVKVLVVSTLTFYGAAISGDGSSDQGKGDGNY